ncbi:MAG: TonB-dependent receptor, partial [Gemmatimonadetes bacterium]|nr:TonB-dependent receptor [Gemmatimonadota bacterium]
MTGVLDMRSRTTAGEARTMLGLSVSNITALSHGGFADDKGAWLFSARRGFMELIMKMIGEDERLAPRYYDVFGKVSYQLGTHHLLSAQVLHTRDEFGLRAIEWDGNQAVPGLDEVDVETQWGSDYGWLTWDLDPSPRVSAKTLGWVGRLTRWRDGYQVDFGTVGAPERITVLDDRRFDFVGARHDLSIELSERAMIKLGAEWKHGRSDYSYSSWTSTPVLTEEGERISQLDSLLVETQPDGHEIGAYLSTRTRVSDEFTAEVGLRYDRMSHTDDEDLSPRILLAYNPKPHTQLRASWGLYHQSHGVHELDVGDGEVEFYPSERAEQIALGFEHRLPRDVSLRLELYRRTMVDQRPLFLNLEQELVIFPEAEGDRFRIDPDRGRAQGMELVVERRSGDHWAWSASYVLAVAEDEVQGSWIPRLLEQRHSVGLNAAYRPNRRWNLSWAWRYHSGWPATGWDYEA